MENKKNIKLVEENEVKNKQKIEIEDYCYRVIEMRDSINESIDNINQNIINQKKLIEIVRKAIENNIIDMNEKEKQYFNKFCDDVEKSCDDYLKQTDELILKRNLLNEVLNRCNNDKDNSELISIFCEAFGIFKY